MRNQLDGHTFQLFWFGFWCERGAAKQLVASVANDSLALVVVLVPDDVARCESQDHQTNEFQHFEKRSNLLVKTSNNLKTLLGVNHFLRGIPVRSIFFEQGKFFQTPCIFAPQFQISYFLGKISDLFSRFIPDPLKL